ncbi:MAG: hypothetical protein BGP14_10490 [Sphingobacteriales bacterium 44-15]|nr:MAG: hypothetical protein BGP14_10490 [Sphingobacteriales bacterium 44-15]
MCVAGADQNREILANCRLLIYLYGTNVINTWQQGNGNKRGKIRKEICTSHESIGFCKRR